MSSCWSCLVILEKGVTACPLCGSDQTRPAQIVVPNSPEPVTVASFFREWGPLIVVIIAFVGSVAGILWHNFGVPGVSPTARAAAVAAKSLRDVREVLSTYAITASDTYPESLSSLANRVSPATQAAQDAGYLLQYRPKSSSTNSGAPRGYVIVARTEKGNYLNLCIDESGVVRATEENRAATLQDPPL